MKQVRNNKKNTEPWLIVSGAVDNTKLLPLKEISTRVNKARNKPQHEALGVSGLVGSPTLPRPRLQHLQDGSQTFKVKTTSGSYGLGFTTTQPLQGDAAGWDVGRWYC